MKKITSYIFIILIFIGGLAVYYSIKWEIRSLTGVGLLCLGLGVMVMGLEAIIKRESIEEDESGNVTTYRGWSAVMAGSLWVLVSITLLVGGVMVLMGQQKNLQEWALEHPGFWLVGMGLIFLTYSGNSLLGSEEERASTLAFISSLPGRVGAVFAMIAGVALLTAGLVEIFLPDVFWMGIEAFQSWRASLPCKINPAYCGE